MSSLGALQTHIYQTAVDKGWYEGGDRNFGEVVALVHSELSEALEEWRAGHAPDHIYFRESDGKPEGIAVEMADALIRILDWFGSVGVDAETVVQMKVDFNDSRPYRHGGKVA